MYEIFLSLSSFMLFRIIEVKLLSYSFLNSLLKLQENNSLTIILLVTVIGGVILTTLSYVSYRKYKAEKEKRKRRGKDKIN